MTQPLLPVDPVLPRDFDDRPNEDRSSAELDRWWDKPFLVSNTDGTFTVRCLNGGAWDRSTVLGRGATAEEATAIGLAAQESWVRDRSLPRLVLEDGSWCVVIAPQRPDADEPYLARGVTAEEAQRLIEQHTPT